MSEETNASPAELVQKALEESLPEVQIVTGLLVTYAYLDSDGDMCWGYGTLDSQGSLITNGLADLGVHYARQRFSHDDH